MSRNSDKADITIMTLLAHEATGDARRLLKSYGYPDAKNYTDLEVKLSELYVKTPDKVALEKRLAEIHPHKKFILKYAQPQKSPNVVDSNSEVEISSNMTDDTCPTTQTPQVEVKSNVSGSEQNMQFNTSQLVVPLMFMTMFSFVAIFVISKAPKI